MGAACIASAGYGMTEGSGVSITTCPIVPDYKKCPILEEEISKENLWRYWFSLGH